MLLALPGVGPAFVERHGEAVLALVGGGEPPAAAAAPALQLDVPPPRTARPRGRPPGTRGDADPELVDRLRTWRLDAARDRAVPAYVVAHDRTLAAIAAARPRSNDDLLAIRGVGRAFVDRHGGAVLALVGG